MELCCAIYSIYIFDLCQGIRIDPKSSRSNHPIFKLQRRLNIKNCAIVSLHLILVDFPELFKNYPFYLVINLLSNCTDFFCPFPCISTNPINVSLNINLTFHFLIWKQCCNAGDSKIGIWLTACWCASHKRIPLTCPDLWYFCTGWCCNEL